MKLGLGSATSWTLGKEGETPIYIAARSGDTIVAFNYTALEGGSATS